jgi:hypothetical protein
VSGHVGFFFACGGADRLPPLGTILMSKSKATMAQQIAKAAIAFE